MVIIGKNIIENLTIGMYENSNIIFREYIQNSADSIDTAIKQEVDKPNEFYIDIKIDRNRRNITIYDNAVGLSKELFKNKLSSIADSYKDRGENKGFRGIGRLGGLAYCEKLIFTSSFKGESVKSIMIWDAKKLREIIGNQEEHPCASELVDKVTSYDEKECDIRDHFFEVQLINIVQENDKLLDEVEVRKYLEDVAPVPYADKFIFRSKIYEYRDKESLRLDEYKILLNEVQVFKNYTSDIYKKVSDDRKEKIDEIKDIVFEKVQSDKGELLAWLWYGISGFEKIIPSFNQMRGIRLRKENIQIGNSETMSKFFKESRGNFYFIGEIFAVHKDLIPNARRDYFNLNWACNEFEKAIRPLTYQKLYNLYYCASDFKSALKDKNESIKLKNNIDKCVFINKEDRLQAVADLEKQEERANKASKRLESLYEKAEKDEIKQKIFSVLEEKYKIDEKEDDIAKNLNSRKYKTQYLSKLNRKEQKLVSLIYTIIKEVIPSDMANDLINKIQEKLEK